MLPIMINNTLIEANLTRISLIDESNKILYKEESFAIV
jgi:hypothetical protein